MNISTPEDLERCLIQILCRNISLREDETTSPVDKFARELLDFSRHFQDNVWNALYKFPARLISSQDLCLRFLNSACRIICHLQRSVEIKVLILVTFVTDITTLSFTLPCYRLVRNMKTVLPLYLNQRYFPGLHVPSALQWLEAIFPLSSDEKQLMCSQFRKLVEIIQTSGESIFPTFETGPDIATHLKAVQDMRAQNAVGTNDPEICPFCNQNCNPYLEPLLNLETN